VPTCPDHCHTWVTHPSDITTAPGNNPDFRGALPGLGLGSPTEEGALGALTRPEAARTVTGLPPLRSVVLALAVVGDVKVDVAWAMELLGKKPQTGLMTPNGARQACAQGYWFLWRGAPEHLLRPLHKGPQASRELLGARAVLIELLGLPCMLDIHGPHMTHGSAGEAPWSPGTLDCTRAQLYPTHL
jgi:hypothetical protein